MNPIARRRRPVECPRCGQETEGLRFELVRVQNEDAPLVMDETPSLADMDLTYETEEWVMYLPCEHTVPPEEHRELVNPTTPARIIRPIREGRWW